MELAAAEITDSFMLSYVTLTYHPPTNYYHQNYFRSRPGKPNQRKGQNEKFTNFAHFFVNSGVLPEGKNRHDSQIELLFRNAPAKSS